MTTLIITGYDDAMREIGDATNPSKDAYASRHGYDFLCARDYTGTYPPSWHKVVLVDRMLFHYERVMWMDGDVAVTNQDIPVIDLGRGLHVSRDWGVDADDDGKFSMGSFLVYNNFDFIISNLLLEMRKNPNREFWEQAAARDIYAENPRGFVVHPRRTFNAVPREVHPSVVDPWQPGDWLIHLTSMPEHERIMRAKNL